MTTKKDSTKKVEKKESTVSHWDKIVGNFANVIGKSLDEVNQALKNLVGNPSDESLALLLNENDCPTTDIKTAFAGVATAKLNNAIRTILRQEEKSAKEPKIEEKSSSAMVSLDILPSELSEINLLDTLKTGGVLKVNSATVTMAMRAALANKTGVYNIRKTLVERMEAYAESLEEPVGDEYIKLLDELTRKKYGDIFAAIPGGATRFMSPTLVNKFLDKIDKELWPSLQSFHEQLQGWMNAWQQGSANPAMLTAALTAAFTGKGDILPQGIMAPPPTDSLRDAADSTVDKINRAFSGTGTIVASGLGYDAKTLMDILNNPSLPAQIGAVNKEQMLKMLNINVTADVSRLATNVSRYALSIMELPKVAAGKEELMYINALFQLGSAIPWEKLKGISKSGIGPQL